MSYGQFLLLFIIPPIVLFGWMGRKVFRRSSAIMLCALAVVALIYTGPWDNLLIANGVWTFSARQVLGVTIGRVPLEEYVFYILQVMATGLWALWLARRLAT